MLRTVQRKIVCERASVVARALRVAMAMLVLVAVAVPAVRASTSQVGPLAQWGGTLTNETVNQPPATESFIAIAAGAAHSLALRPDGALVQWGDSETFQRVNLPASSERFSTIAAGLTHSIALRLDGSLVQWGDATLGQANGAPAASERFVAIACGAYHNLALRADGSLVQWGGTFNGQRTNAPSASERFIAIACGTFHSLALRADGSLVQWGPTNQGQATGLPAASERFTAITAGRFHSVAIRTDGSILQWGPTSLQQRLDFPDPAERFVAVSAGYYHTVALRANGTVVQWGAAGDEQRLNAPRASDRFRVISAGTFHTIALRNTAPDLSPDGATAFTYQGRLTGGFDPATGQPFPVTDPVALRFTLHAAAVGGEQVGSAVVVPGVVPDPQGLFSASVNFGTLDFESDRFVEVAVQGPRDGSFQVLTPRQRITAAPKAIMAIRASQADSAATAGTALSAATVPWSGVTDVPANVALAPWSGTQGGISYTGGNVGIGTTNATQRLTVNGAVLANNVSSPSSMRFKMNVTPMDDALARVRLLRGVRFDWKPQFAIERGFTHDLGLIAESTLPVFPELVLIDPDGAVAGIDYARLAAVAVEAVRQVDQRVDVERDAAAAELARTREELSQARAEIDDLRARLKEACDAIDALRARVEAEGAGAKPRGE